MASTPVDTNIKSSVKSSDSENVLISLPS